MELFLPVSNINSPVFGRSRSLILSMPNPRFFKYNARACLRVSGPDALEFLQGQFSNDLSETEVGGVVYGLWLDRKGKIVADSFVLRRGDESATLLSYFCEGAAVFERLDAYLVMEDAELELSSVEPAGIAVWGEAAHLRACEALGMPVPPSGGFSQSGGVVAFWGRRGVEPALEFMFLDGGDSRSIGALDSVLAEESALELSVGQVAALAIEAKVPQIGRGFGEADLPQELGLEVEAVSFRKGCYLGQEVMARLHAMGRVRKGLKVFSIEDLDAGSGLSLPLDLLDESGKRQGQLRSVAYSKSGGIGLGVVSSGFGGTSLKGEGVEVTLLKAEDSSDG